VTRPPPDDRLAESVADTRRRIRSTTWLAAGAATAASALFGILFAQPDPAAAADPAPSSVTLPSFTTSSPAPSVPAPRTSTARHPHRVTAPAPKPLQPPAQPPRLATAPGRTTSGAS